MIKVNLKYSNDIVESFSITGHANFDIYGKDIVCASVSSIVITSVNAIIRLDNGSIDYKNDDGIYVSVLKHNKVIDTLIDNMVCLLRELEKQYSKNIIISKEVCSC